jgi:pimeloyl-ACP methyl ester carboxylesterase
VSEATSLASFEDRRITVGGRRVRYLVGGAGPPLVLVHGLGGAASNWTELAPILAERHRVLVPDLPGHGGSDPLPGDGGLGPLADRVRRCAEKEQALPAPVVGHSLGGEVALRLAAERREAVEALVLCASSGISCRSRRNRVGLAITTAVRPGRIAGRHRQRLVRRQWATRACFLGLAEATLTPEGALGFLERAATATDTRPAARALVAEDFRARLDRIACPVLILWGARDRIVPPDDGFEYARRLGATLRLLPETGHLLIGERPLECSVLIEEFLESAR